MSTLPVSDKGTYLYYEDTGPLERPYTTYILVHGTAVHGAIFHRLLPFAQSKKLRLVLVNRRDYPGSSPITDEELAPITPPNATNDTQAAFVRSRGVEIAEFLARFIREKDVPPVQHVDGRTIGGLALIGWSSANGTLAGMFGNLDAVRTEARETVGPYLRNYIHFDGPRWALGFPHLEPFSRPFANPDLTDDDRMVVFGEWVSAYYQHPFLSRASYARVPSDLTSDIPANPPPDKVATFARMSQEEKDGVLSRYALFHSEMRVRAIDPAVFKRNMLRAFFGDDGALMAWRDTRVQFLQCSESLWETMSVMWEVESEYQRRRQAGDRKGRSMEFHLMRDANHIPMWDQPERLLNKFIELVDGTNT
ncbi:hypothetical protein FA95DRAFT_1586852 [Auriscalpium vulgare]|uniref:Uncharacterized protein n=1 Tax=Auriscalpium vulgare TaxID=40419 RepID=A0ACB8S8K3_9AGAM|nr:hypothetical protein FA95DRAFT_1586852 [Auriscalpium vulgare]